MRRPSIKAVQGSRLWGARLSRVGRCFLASPGGCFTCLFTLATPATVVLARTNTLRLQLHPKFMCGQIVLLWSRVCAFLSSPELQVHRF